MAGRSLQTGPCAYALKRATRFTPLSGPILAGTFPTASTFPYRRNARECDNRVRRGESRVVVALGGFTDFPFGLCERSVGASGRCQAGLRARATVRFHGRDPQYLACFSFQLLQHKFVGLKVKLTTVNRYGWLTATSWLSSGWFGVFWRFPRRHGGQSLFIPGHPLWQPIGPQLSPSGPCFSCRRGRSRLTTCVDRTIEAGRPTLVTRHQCPRKDVTAMEKDCILLTLTGFGDALRERFGHTNVSSSVSALQ